VRRHQLALLVRAVAHLAAFGLGAGRRKTLELWLPMYFVAGDSGRCRVVAGDRLLRPQRADG